MALETWFAYVVASAVVTLIPGPSVLAVVGQALSRGMPAALVAVIGNGLAGIILIFLSFVGVGAILESSILLFQIIKWAGVLYLAYLGICQIIEARKNTDNDVDVKPTKDIFDSFKAGFLAGALNPKGIIFYVAFLTQFMDPAVDPYTQVFILGTTSTIVVSILLAGYGLLASKARKMFQSRKAKKNINYASGSFFLGGSVMMAVTR